MISQNGDVTVRLDVCDKEQDDNTLLHVFQPLLDIVIYLFKLTTAVGVEVSFTPSPTK